MNRNIFWMVLFALGLTYISGCGSSSNSVVAVSISQTPPGILAPGATAQITATITGTGEGVTWSCTPGNSASTCGSFNPSTTTTGVATTYTAPPTAVGSVTITATSLKNAAASASVNVTITTSGGLAANYSFYLSGWDGSKSNVYSLAGSVAVAANGTVTGEQDFNDGSGLTSPEPGGDMITAGNLSFDPTTGLGTLTLNTNNTHLGVNGTETLSLNFVNSNHALIIQADGSATSSGSFDLQTLPSTPGGAYSFTLSGAGSTGNTTFYGGVFSLSGTSLSNGIFDENHAGHIATNQSFTGTLSSADSFGRGTLTGTGIAGTIVYYIVGPEALRLIDVDTAGTLVGSAYGQGSGNFTVSSQNSVFSVQSNLAGVLYSAVGELFPSGANFTGVADVSEIGIGSGDAVAISGTFAVGTNGYGNLMITSGNFGDVTTFGIYATDPNLNINDPNNSSGGGGALVVDLDTNVAGSGVMVPQTDTSTASFAGNYGVGFQDLNIEGEFDFVGNATASGTNFSGTGTLSDPAQILGVAQVNTGTTFSSTIAPDLNNQGRYLLNPFSMTVDEGGAIIPYDGAIVYQASGQQLFWMENQSDDFNGLIGGSVFSGQIQQQASPVVSPAKVAAGKAQKQ
jgi:hypothetical protein